MTLDSVSPSSRLNARQRTLVGRSDTIEASQLRVIPSPAAAGRGTPQSPIEHTSSLSRSTKIGVVFLGELWKLKKVKRCIFCML